MIGATIGATLIFLFAKAILVRTRWIASAHRPRSSQKASGAMPGPYLLVLRLVPLFPFFLVNLVPAFVGVKLVTYVLTTFFGIIPGTAVFSLAGAGLGRSWIRGDHHARHDPDA